MASRTQIATPYGKINARKKALDDAAQGQGMTVSQPLPGGLPLRELTGPTGAGAQQGMTIAQRRPQDTLRGLPTATADGAQQGTIDQGNTNIPGQAQAPVNSAFDVNAAYSNIGNLLKGASDAGLANTKQQLYAQIPGLEQQYDTLNTQAMTNARLSALGNNENLAAAGLAGNAYAAPQSGYSETSRVGQDVAMGNALNANALARQNALQGITNQIGQAGTAASASLLGQQANLLGQQASAQQQESQFGRTLGEQVASREQEGQQWQQQFDYGQTQDAFTNALNEAGITGLYQGQQTQSAKAQALQQALAEAGLTGTYNGQQTLEAQQLASQQQQQQVDNAMNRVNLMGSVDAAASAILGLPVGTPSWQANQWKQEFDFAKKKAGGGGSSFDANKWLNSLGYTLDANGNPAKIGGTTSQTATNAAQSAILSSPNYGMQAPRREQFPDEAAYQGAMKTYNAGLAYWAKQKK